MYVGMYMLNSVLRSVNVFLNECMDMHGWKFIAGYNIATCVQNNKQ